MKSWTGRWRDGRPVPRAARSRRRFRGPTVRRRRCRSGPRSWAASRTPCRRSPASAPAKSTPTSSSSPTTKPSSERLSEIKPDAEAALDVQPQPWYQHEHRRDLEEHLEEARVVEHQIEADRAARPDAGAVAVAVADPGQAPAGSDVPVQLSLAAHDVGLPEVVHVDRRPVVAAALADHVAVVVGEAAVREPITVEPETEVERVGRRNPHLARETRRRADDDAQAELPVVTDLRGLRRLREDRQQ